VRPPVAVVKGYNLEALVSTPIGCSNSSENAVVARCFWANGVIDKRVFLASTGTELEVAGCDEEKFV